MDMLPFDGFAGICCAGGAVDVVVGRCRVTARRASAAGMILAQNSVDGGDDQHVPKHDDGDKSEDQRGCDQVDGHGALRASWFSDADVAGRTSVRACAAPRA